MARLLVAVGFLDGGGGFLLGCNLIGGELLPQLLKLRVVAFDVEWVVNDEQILLVTVSSLEGPVEGAGEEEDAVDKHELVVHVMLLVVIGADGDSSIGQSLRVVALVLHGLVIGDDANVDTLVVDVLDGVGEHIVGQVEHTDQKRFLGHLDVSLKLVDVVAVGEEESVHVARLGTVEILGHLLHMLAQVGQNFLVSISAHLASSNLE